MVLGDVLGLKHRRCWEWDQDAPLRSPTIPCLLYGLPFILIRLLDSLVNLLPGTPTLLTPLLLQLLPRLVLLPLSLLLDLSLASLTKVYKVPTRQALELLASCNITLVFCTRPLSNTLELIFFSLLLLLLALSSSKPFASRPDWTNIAPLGLICALGTFNRPTFILFAATPLVFWFFSNLANFGIGTIKNLLLLRLLPLSIATLLPLLLIFLTDSLYFGQLSLASPNLSGLKLTPWNFLEFNLSPGNAASFGMDPW